MSIVVAGCKSTASFAASPRLCPATPDAYFNWIPATLYCSSPPPTAEMTNKSGENDVVCVSAVLLFVFLQKPFTPLPSHTTPAAEEKNLSARHPRRQAGIQRQ